MSGILITGGAGFIGSNFCHYWAKNYPKDKLVVLDALTYAGRRENIQSLEASNGLIFIHGNICDQALVEELLCQHKLNTIVHFAAESHVDRSISDPDLFIKSNVVGTHSLLRAAKSVWLDKGEFSDQHRFHHVSTDEVYGSLGPNDPPFTEGTRYAPNSPYSASKAASDHLVRSYFHTFELRTTQSNCSNNYGPYQDNEKLIPVIINSVLSGKQIPIYGDGRNIRDWLYVEDHCRAIDLILKKGKPGEVYNIGGENEWTNIDIALFICDAVDSKLENSPALKKKFTSALINQDRPSKELIKFIIDRPGHDRRYAIDLNKSRKDLNYFPEENFQSGIQKTIEWYLRRV